MALVQGRRDPEVLVLVLDPEREDPQPVDVALTPQEVDPPEREQPAVHPAERLLDVRQRERCADHLPVLLGHHRPVLVEHRLEVLRLERNLRLGDRDEAPVVAPGGVVDLHETGHLGLHVAAAHVAQDDALLP